MAEQVESWKQNGQARNQGISSHGVYLVHIIVNTGISMGEGGWEGVGGCDN